MLITDIKKSLESFDFGTLLSGNMLGAGLGLWSKYNQTPYFPFTVVNLYSCDAHNYSVVLFGSFTSNHRDVWRYSRTASDRQRERDEICH